MKWFAAVMVLLLVPVSAQAESPLRGAQVVIIGEKYGKPEPPHAIRFFIEAHESGDYVRAKVRLFIPKNNPVDAVKKGRCKLWVNTELIAGFGNYWIMGKNGRDLWFPHLRKKDRVVLGIFWDQEQPVMEYATMETENTHGRAMRMWQTARVEHYFQKAPHSERAPHFREFSLDEVCKTFAAEAVGGFQFPKS